ncbi:MAG: helix-turn-helix transcriptional regulator [Provencibacterium sp.]|jgi:transcriptional regulator with XRE-family HTH domain|nr:helix-turn-helix transcriptional regulator [Provencibacterium sp.]
MDGKKPQYIKMGQRFREAREAKGWTRSQLAEKMELSVEFITDLELGNSGIRLDRFASLCQLLNVNAHTALFGSVEQLPTLSHLETMLANRDIEDVRRVTAMLEAVVEKYFDKYR